MLQFTIISPFNWEDPMMNNAVNIAGQLCRKNCVLYAHEPLTVRSQWKLKKKELETRRVTASFSRNDRTDVLSKRLKVYYPSMLRKSINFLPDSRFYRKLLISDSQDFLFSLKQEMLSRNAVQIVLIDNVMFSTQQAREILRPDLLIYYYRDDITSQPYYKRHGKTLEQELMGKCDLVFANSQYLAEKAASYTDSIDIGQGYDPGLFNRDKYHPEEIKQRPRVGYVGNLTSDRLDIDLMETMVIQRPNYDFHFIGPQDKTFMTSLLHRQPNVYFFGPMPVREIPPRIRSFDVAINPQQLNNLTLGNMPRKIDEYLAMGIPTVATSTPAMGLFKDHVYLADDPDEFLEGVDTYMNAPPTSKYLRDFALLHTWEKRVDDMTGIVRQRLRSRASSFGMDN